MFVVSPIYVDYSFGDHQVMFTNVILIKLNSSILSSKIGEMESIHDRLG